MFPAFSSGLNRVYALLPDLYNSHSIFKSTVDDKPTGDSSMPSMTPLSRKARNSGGVNDRRHSARNHGRHGRSRGFLSDVFDKKKRQGSKSSTPAGPAITIPGPRDVEAEAVVGGVTAPVIGEPSFYKRAHESVQPEAHGMIDQSARDVQPSADTVQNTPQDEREVVSRPGPSQAPHSTQRTKRREAKAPYGTQEYVEPRSKQLKLLARAARNKPPIIRPVEQASDAVYEVEDDDGDNAEQGNDGPQGNDGEDDEGSDVEDGMVSGDQGSISFDEPRNAHLLAEVPQEHLGMLFSRVNRWRYSLQGWDKALTLGKGENKDNWLKSQSHRFSLATTSRFYGQLYDLAMLYRELPQDLDDQVSYLSAEQEALRATLKKGRASANNLRNTIFSYLRDRQQPNKWCHRPRKLVMDIVKCIIPLLAVTIREAAAVGGGINRTLDKWSYGTGYLTTTTIQLIMSTVGWTQRIMLATKKLLESNHLIFTSAKGTLSEDFMTSDAVRKLERHLGRMIGDLGAYRSVMKDAVVHLEHIAETDKRNAAAKLRDERIRAAKAERERKRHEHAEQQHLWFIQSTQADYATHLERDWDRDEDKDLLSVIRRTKKPEIGVLVQILPSCRTRAEVQNRVSFLRKSSWDYFVEKGLEPPSWCHEP